MTAIVRATPPPLRHAAILIGMAVLLGVFAMLRPFDHDESQYVAAAVLARAGLPYRDFAYLQTPLQPLLLAPVAALAGAWAYPALRLVNALLGAVTLGATWAAARAAGAGERAAYLVVGLMACCDIFLFTSAVARNDALPGAMLAVALWIAVRAARGRGSRAEAFAAGLLLSGAAAAKISFALPAAAYGLIALADRRHRPLMLIAGAAPVIALVAWLYALAPGAFVFGVFTFPALAPAEWYLAHGMPGKISGVGKAIDLLKFLALGPALLALVIAARQQRRDRLAWLLDALILAALVAALLPVPTWRQYFLPVLPPLFVRLAMAWEARPPGRATRILAVIFAVGGLAPTVEATIRASGGVPMAIVMQQGKLLRSIAAANGVTGPVATLAPQFLPAAGLSIDPRYAAGPFYFRSRHLLGAADEGAFTLVSGARMPLAPPPRAILIGGEGPWTSGEASDEAPLIDYATAHHWRRIAVPGGRFTLLLPPR